MSESFESMLSTGKPNSLGRVEEVLKLVFADKTRLEELYTCIFCDNAWTRMRAVDALEKVGREHPNWLIPYIDRIQSELSTNEQPSIQWHMAQIYKQIDLNDIQIQKAILWLEQLLSTIDVDWIVSANAMETLAHFTRTGHYDDAKLHRLLEIQTKHKSNSVVKRSHKITTTFDA
jgi:hypothetical protein